MRRLLVTETGDSFGRFNDGSTVFVSSSCQIVVETDKNNKQVTHIINFINASLKQKVEQMVIIRNKYFWPICLPPFMQQITARTTTNGYKKLLLPLTECIWNQECQQGIEEQTIKSCDGHTSLQLHTNRHKISVSFPINIKNSKEIQVTADGSPLIFYNHIQQTQVQSIYNHDISWAFPLHLLTSNCSKHKIKSNTKLRSNKSPLPQIQMQLQENCNSNSLQETMAKLSDECRKAIEYFHCSQNGIPPNQIIVVEWTLNVVYRIFNSPNYLVETFILLDDSYLVTTQNKEFMHHYDNKAIEYVYCTKAIPPIPPSSAAQTYDLTNIAENALNLLENALSINRFQQTATSNNISLAYATTKAKTNNWNKTCLSNQVKDYHINPKFGEFTYYKDKRVKIHFSDRTMLEMNSDWNLCTIITKYGQEIRNIDCKNPIQQFSQYIQHALNYANWCCLSKKEQLHFQQTQLKIQNDIQKQINFSNRLVETQQITQLQDYSMVDTVANNIKSDNFGSGTNIENKKLIQSIQTQLIDIDKLLQ